MRSSTLPHIDARTKQQQSSSDGESITDHLLCTLKHYYTQRKYCHYADVMMIHLSYYVESSSSSSINKIIILSGIKGDALKTIVITIRTQSAEDVR